MTGTSGVGDTDSRGLTEEEARVLAKSDAEIIRESRVFCFNKSKFSEHLYSGDSWSKIIRCHLYIDHILEKMLLEAMPSPEALKIERIGFSGKLDLCLALGFLPKEVAGSVRVINKLRNQLAHTLKFDINNEDVDQLKNATPTDILEVGTSWSGRESGPIQLSDILLAVALKVEVSRQIAHRNRALEQKAAIDLKAEINEVKGKFLE